MSNIEAQINPAGIRPGTFHREFNIGKEVDKFTLPQDSFGSFQDLTALHIVHKQHISADQQLQALIDGGDPRAKEIMTSIADQVDWYEANLLARRNEVYSPENREKGAAIAEKLAQVEAYKQFGMDAWVRARIAVFGDIRVASDVDKTITYGEGHLNYIVGSLKAENYVRHPENGREAFIAAYVRYWREAVTTFATQMREVGHNVPLRPGVENFFTKLAERGNKAKLISANFTPLIEGVRDNLPQGSVDEIRAVDGDDLFVIDKGTEVFQTVLDNEGKGVIYFGDGPSDIPVLEDAQARELVTCYFALEGSEFHHALEAMGLPFYTYKDFNDITKVFERLGLFPSNISHVLYDQG